jgi:hypothetical protein
MRKSAARRRTEWGGRSKEDGGQWLARQETRREVMANAGGKAGEKAVDKAIDKAIYKSWTTR